MCVYVIEREVEMIEHKLRGEIDSNDRDIGGIQHTGISWIV